VKRRPQHDAAPTRSFELASWSLGSLWQFVPGYGLGTTLSLAQRAPVAEELYSNGAHEASRTFDIGDAQLEKEKSRNIELSLQKTSGSLRWKANLFHNRAHDFVYGRTAATVDEGGTPDPNGEFLQRFWSQADATIHGAELEIGYNQNGPGWSWRGFADTARGKLDGRGNLPLQPTTRVGLDLGFRRGPWQAGINLVHAQRQKHLATFESSAAPAYTLLDAQWSYAQRVGASQWTWFAMLKNVLDEEVRASTSLLKEFAPQPGRGLVAGLRIRF
jgi:iron complex outermembrane recepter protein